MRKGEGKAENRSAVIIDRSEATGQLRSHDRVPSRVLAGGGTPERDPQVRSRRPQAAPQHGPPTTTENLGSRCCNPPTLLTPTPRARYQQYILCFNIERWLTRLDGLTFGTAIIPVDPSTAREMISRYERLMELKTSGALSMTDLSEYPGLDALRARLGQCIGTDGAFVKSSSRSAKVSSGRRRQG